MKKLVLFAMLVVMNYGLKAQYDINGDYKISGKLGVGTENLLEQLNLSGNLNMTGSSRRIFMGGVPASTFGLAYSSAYPNYGIFYTEGSPDYVSISPNGNANNGVLNIYGNGNVGIGTNNPNIELDIKGSINLNNQYSTDTDYLNPGYYVYKNNTVAYGMKLQYTGNEFGTMIFGPNQENRFIGFGKVGQEIKDNSMIEFMRIDLDDGNVGIGTSAPGFDLDVDGNINYTGNLLKNGDIIPALTTTEQDIANWNTAFSWGDHSTFGYINESFLIDRNYIKLDNDTSLSLLGGLKDKDGDIGSAGQILSSTSNGTNWIDAGIDGQWQKTNNKLSVINSNISEIAITNNSDNTLAIIKAVSTNDVSNYAGAVFAAKGSGPEYTNNMYFGKYGQNFYISSWAGNGVMATDKDLVISAVGSEDTQNPNPDPQIIFQTGGGYSNPQTQMILNESGNLSIGTSNTTYNNIEYKLTVKGKIHAEEVLIDLNIPAPDYVFEKDYPIKTIQEVERYINKNKHLPEIPSATEIAQNGLSIGEMNMLLLKKIEELTLYAIEQDKKTKEQSKKIKMLEEQNAGLKNLTVRLLKLEKEFKELKK